MDIHEILKVKVFREYSLFAKEIGAINLSQGIPEPLMDETINHHLKESLHYGWAYTDTRGIKELRETICNDYANDFNPDEVLITSGGAESLYIAVAAAKELYGNKIAFIAPFFPFYKSLSLIFNLEALSVPMLKNANMLTPDFVALENLFKQGVKTFILNTPHNPSGWTLNLTEAKLLRNFLDKYGVLLIVDEVYRHYVYNDAIEEEAAIKTLYQDNKHILILGSASKLLSVTGMRVGWLIGDNKLLEIPYALHSHTSHCQPAPFQHAITAILNNPNKSWFNAIKDRYQIKRDKLITALRGMGFKCYDVDGGHFILAEYADLSNETDSDIFARDFARTHGVLPLTTNVFYDNNCAKQEVRFSITATINLIDATITKLTNLI